jgi:pimeloyl-ACP methyl ester carboxylesterase
MVTATKVEQRKRGFRLPLSVLLALALLSLYVPARQHSSAVSLLMHIADPNAHGVFADYDTRAVQVVATTVNGPSAIRAKLYLPANTEHAPAMVVLHGVHHLGIEEPRLVNFSRAIASHGTIVLTPEMADLADYHVEPDAIEVIGASVHDLVRRTGAQKVGVLGLSFAGGLALIAAGDPRFAPEISFVTAVGAHDDLARVLRFFATNQIPRPDGSTLKMQAHEYGPLVVAYASPEDFFSAADVAPAREAIKLWLWEKPDAARQQTANLTPQGREKLDRLFAHRVDVLGPELLAAIEKHRDQIASVSPAGKLGRITCPVLVVHGAGDNVIPPSETEWLAEGVPSGLLVEALISPAVSHVEVGGSGPGLRDKLNLVHFMSEMLSETAESPKSTVSVPMLLKENAAPRASVLEWSH